jgi:hypothetical protein
MKQIVEYSSSGGSILIEVSEPAQEAGGPIKASRGAADAHIEKAGSSFEDALATVVSAANAFVTKTSGLTRKPDELTVEFGLKTSGKMNLMVVSCDAEANFNVTLTWSAKASSRG